jgi:hypothetical protein
MTRLQWTGKAFLSSSVCNSLAVCCDTRKAGSFYTDGQNLHRTDKRLVLNGVDIRAYEYSDTYPDFGGTERLQTHIIWSKAGYIDGRFVFGPFTGCDSFYLTCTYAFLLFTWPLRRLVHCFHRLNLAISSCLALFLLFSQLLYRLIILFLCLSLSINSRLALSLEFVVVFNQFVSRLFV